MPLHDQFLLSQGPRPHPDDWSVTCTGPWSLATSPTLPVTPLLNADGACAGWLLGWVVGPGGELLHERGSLAAAEVVDPQGEVEDRLYRFTGRWACVLLGAHPRCYLDPAGSLAAVYSAPEQALASTTTALRFGEPGLADRYEHRTLRASQYLPAGLTSDPKVYRLLPNHHLDLVAWEPVRHWPVGPVARVGDDGVEERVQAIADSVRHLLRALAARHELVLPLTAGRDSRIIAAAARPVLDRCTFATFAYSDERSTDVDFAREVARRFDLRLAVLPLGEVDERTARDYLDRTGYDANEGKAADFDLAARALPLDQAWVTGFAGEVGRGAYWWQHDLPDRVSPAELLRLIRLPADATHERALAVWMDAVPHQDVRELLDLAYLEFRVGCWAAPQMYGTAPFAVNAIAMNQRSVFSAMLELPLEYRAQQRLRPALARVNWPELAALPYDRAPGLRGWGAAARRAAEGARDRLALRTRAARLLGDASRGMRRSR
ncbi:asparagine synthetase B family protein [Kineococcus auxinigenes]|uniref:hypothetical protein n=1 Tax=unclassified Kineococcus TaxID=2621656 RepID=UPI003D7E6E26